MTQLTETTAADLPAGRAGRSAADLDSVAEGLTGRVAAEQLTAGNPLDDGATADSAAANLDAPGAKSDPTAANLDDILESLKDVVDPELGVNIVDLGLIYDLELDADQLLTIDMTLTSAACPLTDMIEDQVAAALMPADGPLVADYKINWVWLPPWGPDKITDDGREQLQALGFNI